MEIEAGYNRGTSRAHRECLGMKTWPLHWIHQAEGRGYGPPDCKSHAQGPVFKGSHGRVPVGGVS